MKSKWHVLTLYFWIVFVATLFSSGNLMAADYCASAGNSVNYEWIDSITVGGFTNDSGSNGGYADFTSDIIELSPGPQSVTLVPGFGSGTYTEHWSLWIDLNQDGEFASDELLHSGSSRATITTEIQIPDSALSGQTGMRISMKYGSAPAACESFTYGEVEDYTVHVVGGTGDPDDTPADYCASAGNSVNYEWIDSITVGGFTNDSGSNGGYADFTSDIIELSPGAQSVTLVPGFGSGSYNENWSLWIDLNQDGDFASDELLYSGRSNATITTEIQIPDSALSGQTRMRISMKYGSAPTACESFTHGEVEDYTAHIVGDTDSDSDGDGVDDVDDAFPDDPNESVDTDGDGIGNNADADDDGDGVDDIDDAFPLDANESADTDGDGIGNNGDTDDDGDGIDDINDAFPLDANESVDTDGDGIGNNADTDDDNDGVLDADDAFPVDSSETTDTDGDGTGDNADTDDDADGVDDVDDAFPLDANESVDTDGDGTGNNADTDDDGDGLSDEDEVNVHGTDPLATDSDNDGMPDAWEVEHNLSPTVDDANEDADGDGVTNADEYAAGTDPAPPVVVSTLPADSEASVLLDAAISATFSEEMEPTTLTTSTFVVSDGSNDIDGTISTDGTTAVFTPSEALSYNTTYTATVSQDATDLSGNSLDTDVQWSFTTIKDLVEVPNDYTTIQAAVDAVAEGGTVIVDDGEYTENISIDKSVTIESRNGYETTAVVAESDGQHVFTINAPNVTIKGLDISGAHTYYRAGIYFGAGSDNGKAIDNRCGYDDTYRNYIGIYVSDSDNMEISNNICNWWGLFGIYVDQSDGSSFTGNTIEDHSMEGIHLWNASSCTISENAITRCRTGIQLRYTDDVTVADNNSSDNTEHGIRIYDSGTGNAITGNTSNSNTEVGIYVESTGATTVNSNTSDSNGVSGVVIYSSNSSFVSGNNSDYNEDYGIYINNSDNCTVSDNSTVRNQIGIRLNYADDNEIIGNESKNNSSCGIEIYFSTGNFVTENIAQTRSSATGGCGIYYRGGSGNTTYLNSLIGSDYGAVSVRSDNNAANNWISPNEIIYTYNDTTFTGFIGNYYSDHTLTDSDGDGITDTDMDLPGSEPDGEFPMAAPLESYDLQ